jgi:hypothetical protein
MGIKHKSTVPIAASATGRSLNTANNIGVHERTRIALAMMASA